MPPSCKIWLKGESLPARTIITLSTKKCVAQALVSCDFFHVEAGIVLNLFSNFEK